MTVLKREGFQELAQQYYLDLDLIGAGRKQMVQRERERVGSGINKAVSNDDDGNEQYYPQAEIFVIYFETIVPSIEWHLKSRLKKIKYI